MMETFKTTLICNEEILGDKNLITSQGKINGISFAIETSSGKKILFDFSISNEVLENNSKSLEIDLGEIEMAVLSHLHFDHSNGIEYFCKENEEATVYINEEYTKTKGKYYAVIGCDQKIEEISKDEALFIGSKFEDNILDRIEFVPITDKPELIELTDEVSVITKINQEYALPNGSKDLFVENSETGKLEYDQFSHEMAMIIKDGNNTFLFSGCSHNGIDNILKTIVEDLGIKIDYCFGGFHLQYGIQDFERIAKTLKSFNIKHFYTMHCTGYEEAKELMEHMDSISYMYGGETFSFD